MEFVDKALARRLEAAEEMPQKQSKTCRPSLASGLRGRLTPI